MMKCKILLSASLALAMFARSTIAAPIISVDIDEASDPDTAPGFTSLPVSFNSQLNPSVTVGAITVTLDGHWGARDRGVANPANNGAFTDNLLLRDTVFPFDPGPGPFTMTVSGLTPGLQYDTSLWSYDSAVGTATYDISANGNLLRDDYSLTIPPTTNDQHRIDFLATADAAGKVVVSLSDYKPAVGPTGYAEYRLNAIQMTLVPEPCGVALLGFAFAALCVVRCRVK